MTHIGEGKREILSISISPKGPSSHISLCLINNSLENLYHFFSVSYNTNLENAISREVVPRGSRGQSETIESQFNIDILAVLKSNDCH